MLKVSKLWALLYKDAFKSTKFIAIIGLGISVLAPLWNMYSVGYGTNKFYQALASETGFMTFIFIMIMSFALLQHLYQVWISNKFRMLPVYTHQLYFSAITAMPLGVFSSIGMISVLNGIICYFASKEALSNTNFDFSAINFNSHDLISVIVNASDVIISSFVSVTFVLILVEVVRQIVNKKYQKIVQVLAFLLFFWLLTIGVDNVSNLLHISSTNSMNLARLVFDIVLVALEILFSILLIDKKISTLH